jgi:K+-sensing histidine kinase KdpD
VTRPALAPRSLGAICGFGGIVIISFVFWQLLPDVPSEIPALLLLVPIAAASVLSDWRIGLPVAALAGITYAFVLLPPFGEVSIGYTQDVFITVTFVAVAIVVSVLVSRRSIATRAQLIGHERMLLLRSVSHDLRNPLNTVLNVSTELLEGPEYDVATRASLLGTLIDETERMNRIVENLLSLSRMQAGALSPTIQRISVGELIEHSIARLGRLGAHVISFDAPDDLPDVLADPVQIDQVVTNLIENSVRHSPAGVEVCVTARWMGDKVEVAVSDGGPGLSAEAMTGLFQPFRSAGQSTGLGLTVCKAVVDAHGGTIAITSEPGQGGARVAFTLPLAPT